MKEELKSVPYVVYESAMARCERQRRALIVVILALSFCILAIIALGVHERLQYDYADLDNSVKVNSSDGDATLLQGGSSINYGVYPYNTESENTSP